MDMGSVEDESTTLASLPRELKIMTLLHLDIYSLGTVICACIEFGEIVEQVLLMLLLNGIRIIKITLLLVVVVAVVLLSIKRIYCLRKMKCTMLI